jgi:hypothetical protein
MKREQYKNQLVRTLVISTVAIGVTVWAAFRINKAIQITKKEKSETSHSYKDDWEEEIEFYEEELKVDKEIAVKIAEGFLYAMGELVDDQGMIRVSKEVLKEEFNKQMMEAKVFINVDDAVKAYYEFCARN